MKRLKFETIGSISAIVVGLAAVAVSWDQARTTRRQQEAAVLPLLKIQTRFLTEADGRSFRIDIANIGTGPAFIEGAAIAWEGEPLTNFDELGAATAALRGEEGSLWTAPLQGNLLGSGERYTLFEARWPPGDDAATATADAMWQSLKVEACYCSVYERCWRTGMNRFSRPEPARCESGEE
ncbi:hypothetical protein [Parvularcula dongshanensis]|uniref:Uncharacterized protein n=1 Tax=Parvularcula dongshanensis TaxID=1173995 RepID=A0A840I142_9PROT|nr:hypothetical protein [Parvularcula dongshanensis]MBB4658001.1 hypothetical protein [Parvularcula dongshanensis]